MDSQSIDTTSAVKTKTGPVDDIDCVHDASIVVDEQTICEQFCVAMKDENKDQRSIDTAVESLKEMLKTPATTLKVTISGGKLSAVTHGKKTFTGTPCKGSGNGNGLMYKKDEGLYTNTTRFRIVRAWSTASIFFLGDSSVNPLGIFAGKIDPPAKATDGGTGTWTK